MPCGDGEKERNADRASVDGPKTLPPDFVAGLPSFCAPIRTDNDLSGDVWIDFWAVRPSGDPALDRASGSAYAAEALCYATEKCEPLWLDIFITWMGIITFEEGRAPGPLEIAFLDGIRAVAPETFDRILARWYAQNPRIAH